jgi:glycosyltransferase involved in cell wall biosynthesis
LIPVYTPTRTDEKNVSRPHVLFGGISVYLQQYSSLFRKTPRFLDRLWDAPGVIGAFAGRMISNDPRMLGDLTLSMLEGESGLLKKEFEKLVEWVRAEPLPDVINLPNSLLIALAAPLKREFGRPIVCTLQGEELFIEGLVSPYKERALQAIRKQVSHVDRFLAVSRHCAEFMTQYLRIPSEKISVVPLGINMTGYEKRKPGGDVFRIGYFARIAPEKGLHVLAEAFVKFQTRVPACSLEAAGYVAPMYSSYLDKVTRTLRNAPFTYHGVVDRNEKLSFLGKLDVLCVPATYDEPKGMSLLEAMACGVPVVQPRRGAFTEIVEKTSGGVLVPPENAGALADAFYALWQDRARHKVLSDAAFDNVREHYTVRHSADRLLDVLCNLT